jgi:hypothetical protein
LYIIKTLIRHKINISARNMNIPVGKLIRWIGHIIKKEGATMSKGINLWSKGLSKLSPQKFEHYKEPIARQNYNVSGHLTSGVSSCHTDREAMDRSATRTDYSAYSIARNSLLIGLPPGSTDQHEPKLMEECMKKDMTAKDLIEKLASKLRVNKDKWVLVVVSNEKTPYVLDTKEKVEKFVNSKTERLYFYPEFVVRR